MLHLKFSLANGTEARIYHIPKTIGAVGDIADKVARGAGCPVVEIEVDQSRCVLCEGVADHAPPFCSACAHIIETLPPLPPDYKPQHGLTVVQKMRTEDANS